MPDKPKPDGVFISCVSAEFEKVGAPFPGLRGQLRGYLARTRCNVRVQEDFPQTAVDTVRKLADEIRPRAVVIHLVGEKPGAIANPAAVAEYLKDEPNFLARLPELRAALGDFSGISYTQWEAFIALHHDIPLLVYATDKASAQQEHLDRLRIGRRYAIKIKNDTDLFGQLIGDLHDILRSIPMFTRKISGTQLEKHAPRVLFGRETDLAALDAAWAKGTLNVYTLVAWGGAGKTSLVFHWVQTRFAAKEEKWPGVERYFDWSFYSQGTGESRQTSADLFIAKALEFFGDPDPTKGGPHERGERLAGLIRQHRTLLILDGIEPLHVAAAVNGLRASGRSDVLPRSLLTASLYHFVRGEHDVARKHLAEAQQIAERGPMPLFLADIHLHRARMFHDPAALAQAAHLIRTLAYARRTEELLDAEAALE